MHKVGAAVTEKDAVRRILDGFGLASNGVLIVHSAFRHFSRYGFRAEAFIEALMDELSHGTLLMPVMTWRTVTIENPKFDELATRSETGVLSEIFRTKYATTRSIHPTHSTAAWGRHSAFFTKDHQIGVTPCPPHSPFGKLCEFDGHILMLGVGLETCTAIHCWEEQVAPDYYIRPLSEAVIYDCRDRHGYVHRVRARRHQRLNRDFPKFAATLRQEGKYREGAFGDGAWQQCRVVDLQETVMAALAKNPAATVSDMV
ncbi:MAG: AAC(3) family N-acetyltransferase [Alphaproteobacteria bacterium]